jgi:DNA-binding transcriptional ArsR family regulator
LSHGAKTPSDITRLLGLSPSTVSQHLKELKESGRVEEFRDEHFKNIKYYRRAENLPIFASNRTKIAIGALAIAVVAALLVSFSGSSQHNIVVNASGSNVGIFLTDPPQVPAGTQSLIVSYSSIEVQVTNKSGTSWYSINGSGTVNLMSLVNFSKALTSFKLPNNSIVDRLKISISNASIIINGTAYPVKIPENNVSVNVLYHASNGAPFDILFDMYPTVSAIVSGNQTIFIMSPSAAATTINKSSNPYYVEKQALPSGYVARLNGDEENAIAQSRADIIITNASIATTENQSSIELSVSDKSNYSTRILGVLILGNESYWLNLNLSYNGTKILGINPNVPYATNPNQYAAGWHGQYIAIHADQGQSGAYLASGNSSNEPTSSDLPAVGLLYGHGIMVVRTADINLNESDIESLSPNLSNSAAQYRINGIIREKGLFNISPDQVGNAIFAHISEDVAAASYIKSRLDDLGGINFFVNKNGTMEIPGPSLVYGLRQGHDFMLNLGYNLSSGSSATLRYNGSMSVGTGDFRLQFRPGQTYHIIVFGTGCAIATANITAT